jgi:hypothetical protein
MPDDPKKRSVEFGTPAEVIEVVKAMQDVEDERASDRAKINSLFNGQRPYTDEECQQFNIQINVNWGEGKKIMRDANSQLNNALLHPGTLFQCTLTEGPVDKREQWSQIFTKLIHKPIQKGPSGQGYFFLMKNRNASVCLHGIGALMWPNQFCWKPRFVPMEDLLIPTESYADLSNVRYFAVNLYLTVGELIEMTQGDYVNKGWNQKMIKEILEGMKDLYSEGTPSTWRDQPEAMRQIFVENKGFLYNDAIPKVRCVQFFWYDPKDPDKWYRVVYLRENPGSKVKDINKKFLFDGTGEPFANHINEIINIQYGDNSVVPTLKYHTVRGLGVDLYAPVETMNRLRCEFVQSVFEHLKMYFRIKDPADRDRLKAQILQQYGYIMDGLEIVKRDERHVIDPGLVSQAMNEMAGNMQQSSSSFVPNQEVGSEKTMTAKEASIRQNQATVLVSAMLQTVYLQESFFYYELVRRFCQKNPTHKQVKEFQYDCNRQGIPIEMMDHKKWDVVPERVLGGGDKSLAQQQALWLLSVKNMYSPTAQQNILRTATSTMLDDPAKGIMLVPLTPPQSTPGVIAAENVFGTLLSGNQVALRENIDQQGYIATLTKMLGTVIQRVTGTDNMGTPADLVGMVTVIQNIGQHLMILAADPQQKQFVKQISDALAQMTNLIKAFAQRQNQAKMAAMKEGQKDQQKGQEGMVKAKTMLMTAAVKAQIQQANAKAKQNQRQVEFQLEQARKNMELMAEIKREDVAHQQELMNQSFERALEAMRAASAVETGS